MTAELEVLMRRVLLAVLLLVLVAGCSGPGGSSSSDSPGSSNGSAEKGLGAPADGAGGTSVGAPAIIERGAPVPPDQGAGAGVGGVALPPPDGRSVVYTADLTVETDDVAAAAGRAADAAKGLGGLLFGRAGDASAVSVTLKVPTDRFDALLGALTALGHETDRRVSAQDVSGDVADVESRLATQRASVDRVRALLARATTVGEVVAVEAELVKREAELESLEARSRVLAAQVTLATVSLRLVPRPVVAAAAGLGFGVGLAAGWRAFVRAAAATVTLLGVLLPFAVPLAVAAGCWLLVRGRLRRRPPAEHPAG